MRVIANRDCYFTNIDKDTNTKEITDIKSVFKGSVYTVIGKKFDPRPYMFIDDQNYYPHGVWFYELLEQSGQHCSALFTELPDEVEDLEEEIEKDKPKKNRRVRAYKK